MSSSRWIPLESNPEIFNAWANKAGLVEVSGQFDDVYGLDPELLGMVPKPVKAVVLVFPYGEAKAIRKEEEERIAKDGQPELDDSVFWMKQTIGNACGTMALIHSLANADITIEPGSALAQFIDECKPMDSLQRAKHLETTPHFASIHKELASTGQSSVPDANAKVDLHYTCFVEAPAQSLRTGSDSTKPSAEKALGSGMRLVELDGSRNGPVDRGECKDLLTDAARVIKELYIKNSNSVHFNVMYLGQPMQ